MLNDLKWKVVLSAKLYNWKEIEFFWPKRFHRVLQLRYCEEEK